MNISSSNSKLEFMLKHKTLHTTLICLLILTSLVSLPHFAAHAAADTTLPAPAWWNGTQCQDQLLRRSVLYPLGLAHWHTGDRAAAQAALRESLGLRQRSGDWPGLATALEDLAELAMAEEEAALAARWLGVAARLRVDQQVPRPPVDDAAVQSTAARARETLGDTTFDAATFAGETAPLVQTIADIRAWLGAS